MVRRVSKIRIEGEIAYVELTRGYETIIDKEDVPLLADKKCRVIIQKRTNYAMYSYKDESGKHRSVGVHRFLMNVGTNLVVDHINGNGLDNRRCNLRIATRSQNYHNSGKRIHNTSGYKGVYWDSKRCVWCAAITKDNKRKYLGHFNSAEEAHEAYCEAGRRLHGEFFNGG